MGLRRKGTKKIVVENPSYRWVVVADDEPGMAMVVEHFDSPGQRLVSWVEHGVTISPKLVRSAILDGLEAGWNPLGRGADLVRRVAAFSRDQA
jgi:hypothetical protein